MVTDRWLLPEGVDELLPPQAIRLEELRRLVLDQFASWGYALVMPPFMDYVSSLLTGTGSDLDLQTFKIIDQHSGRMMGVRADMTPQVARIDARRILAQGPSRLCYVGTVLHALPGGLGTSRIPIQVGAELYGHRGIESDCEVVCLMLETLRVTGVEGVHLDLGHVGIYRGLARQADLNEAGEAELHDALQRKAAGEVKALTRTLNVSSANADMLAQLTALNGGSEVLARARLCLSDAGDEVAASLDELEALAGAVARRWPGVPIHFDLAELRGYQYHTGVVFAALVPGYGSELARGGRYDEIGNVFGRSRAATGFSTDLKLLMTASACGESPLLPGILAPWGDDAALQDLIARLRQAGERVIFDLPGAQRDSLATQVDRVIEFESGQWQVQQWVDRSTEGG